MVPYQQVNYQKYLKKRKKNLLMIILIQKIETEIVMIQESKNHFQVGNEVSFLYRLYGQYPIDYIHIESIDYIDT